jgi:hypothetical protein
MPVEHKIKVVNHENVARAERTAYAEKSFREMAVNARRAGRDAAAKTADTLAYFSGAKAEMAFDPGSPHFNVDPSVQIELGQDYTLDAAYRLNWMIGPKRNWTVPSFLGEQHTKKHQPV